MFVGFVVGWMRTEENTFPSVLLEKVRTMPVRARQLLGYAHVAIGVVDVRSPMVLHMRHASCTRLAVGVPGDAPVVHRRGGSR